MTAIASSRSLIASAGMFASATPRLRSPRALDRNDFSPLSPGLFFCPPLPEIRLL